MDFKTAVTCQNGFKTGIVYEQKFLEINEYRIFNEDNISSNNTT